MMSLMIKMLKDFKFGASENRRLPKWFSKDLNMVYITHQDFHVKT